MGKIELWVAAVMATNGNCDVEPSFKTLLHLEKKKKCHSSKGIKFKVMMLCPSSSNALDLKILLPV